MSIEIRNVWKSYGTVQALQDCSLRVGAGELLVLLGPSGCGKTTLLRTIAGFLEPDSGEILIDGQGTAAKPVRERHIAFIMENWGLYPHLNVRANIAYPLMLRKTPAPEKEQRVNDVARMLGIEDLLNRRTTELSGGQKQRVAIARALIRDDAKALLADEALSNIDARLRHQLRAEFKELQKGKGWPCIFVTHSQDEALAIGDRVAVMCEGKIVQVAYPRDLYSNPNCIFVASFVGNPPMNFLSVSSEAGRVSLNGKELTLNKTAELPEAGSLVVGIRPEGIELCSYEMADLNGEVVMVENAEPDVLIHVELDEHRRIIVRQRTQSSINTGETVGMRFRREAICLFNAETGKRLF